MAEAKQFKEQYLEIEQIMEFKPEIKCIRHPKYTIKFLNLNSSQDILVCNRCFESNRLESEKLILLEDIFQKEKGYLIKNWPPLKNEKIYQQLIQIDVAQKEKQEVIQKVIQQFDLFRKDILKSIDDHQKKILVHINSIQENRLEVLKIYDKISEKENIIKQFQINQDNVEALENYLRNIVQIKQNQIKQDEDLLQDCFDNLTQYEEKIQLNGIDRIFEQILIQLKNIDFLNQHQPSKSQFHIKENILFKSDPSKPKQKIFGNNKNRYNIVDINKKNNNNNLQLMIDCKSQQNEIKEIQIQNNPINNFEIIEQIQINHQEDQKVNIFPYNNQIQYLKINNNNLNNDDSFQIDNYSNQYGSQISENRGCIKQIVDFYFEDKNIQRQQVIDLIPNIDIHVIKCKYQNTIPKENSDFISIGISELNKLKINSNKNMKGHGFVVFQEQIIPNKKYEIEIQISEITELQQVIFYLQNTRFIKQLHNQEIIQQNQLNQQEQTGLYFQMNQEDIENNRYLLMQDVKEITIQICLSQNFIRFQTILNNQQNKNYNLELNSRISNQNYNFMIGLLRENQELVVKKFQMVDSFEN